MKLSVLITIIFIMAPLQCQGRQCKTDVKGNEVCESDGWHSDKDFNDAVRQFHDRDARQPNEDLKSAKGLLEDLKKEIRRQMAEQGVFTCSRFESRGSTYEGVKVKKSATDDDLEFDIICVMEGGKDLQATPMPGTPGYAMLKPKTGKESRPVFQKTMDKNKNNAISAEKLRNLFYAHLDKCNFPNVEKKYHWPAVELDYWRDGRKFFSVDLAPHFDLGSNELYVPKAPRDNSNTEAWFRSYTMDEKKKFDGLDRDNGCRKMVLRILKALRHKFSELNALKSNQLKTVLLKEVDAQPSWRQDQLGQRLMDVLQRLEDDLTRHRMDHYYMKEVDIFNFTHKTMDNMRDRIRRLRKSKTEMMTLLSR